MSAGRKIDLDAMIAKGMEDPEFAKAWEETELEDQIKRLLIELRMDSGLTQEELSAASGVRQSNISRIENGECMPTLKTLDALARGAGRKLRLMLS